MIQVKMTLRGKNEKLDLSLVLIILITAGMAINSIYFSSIGTWGEPFMNDMELIKRGLGFAAVLLFGLLLDMAGAYFKNRPQNLKEFLKSQKGSSTVSGLLLLLLMTSFSVPNWLFLGAAVILAVLHYFKVSLSLSAVLAYFLLILAGQAILGEVNFLTAPYMESLHGDWLDFRRQFHSIAIVAAGMASGPLSFNLLLPIIVGAFLLANRKYGPMFWSFLFFLVFSIFSSLYIGMSQWRLPLFLLNGSIFTVGVFFIPWELKNLKPRSSKLMYTGLLGVAAFIFSYYLHFIWGAYLAFFMVHLLLRVGAWLDKRSNNG